MTTKPTAADIAIVTKLVRSVFIAAVIPLMAYVYARRFAIKASARGARAGAGTLFPVFILGFVAMALIRSIGGGGLNRGGLALSLWGSADWSQNTALISSAAGYALATALAKAGKRHPLAVTGSKRSAIAQELPTIAEAGIDGYAVDIWFGIVAPASTPKEIVAKLNAAIAGMLKGSEFRQRLALRGYEAIGDTPQQFAATIRANIEKFGDIIKRAGIKAEM